MAGFREFQTGEVLTAANVNDFLSKQAVMKFADSAARDTALGTAVGGSNALREGMVAYLDDTDAVQVHNGTAWGPIAQGVPSGVIVMWSGAIVNIPSGWSLCDGTNSTPDLRNRFIVGAGDTYAVDATGGADSVALTEAELPAHTHDVGTLATSTTGAHTHSVTSLRNLANAGNFANGSDGRTDTFSTGSNGDHSHSITGETGSVGSGTAHENRPPYYALAYIMKD